MSDRSGANSHPPDGIRLDGLPVYDEDHPWWAEGWERMRAGDGKTTGFGSFVTKNMDTIGSVPEEVLKAAQDKWYRLYQHTPCPFAGPETVRPPDGNDGPNGDGIDPDDPPENGDTDADMRTELRAVRTELVTKKQHDPVMFRMAADNMFNQAKISSKIPAQMNIDECNLVLEEIAALAEMQKEQY